MNFEVCMDCFLLNEGMLDSFDYYYGPQSDEIINKHSKALDQLIADNNLKALVFTGDHNEFSTQACECCKSRLHGERHTLQGI